MSFTVARESFDRLTSYWHDPRLGLKWGSVFVLPAWLEVWWRTFKPDSELCLTVVRDGSDIIGIAPLQRKGNEAFFVGSPDVCDYQDLVTVPGKENEFYGALLDDLVRQGVSRLDLKAVRPDSSVMTDLMGVVERRGGSVVCQEADVTVEMDLPGDWEEYLAGLDKKQRHEVRRKLRRLWGADDVEYRCLEVNKEEAIGMTDTFLKLFALSREEKADFMTPQMEGFFRSLTETMAEIKFLRYGILEVAAQPAAMIMGFDYEQAMYLYNSAYDPRFNSLSVGLLSKLLCIRESITLGRKKWDFLKGAEKYKYQLGGNEIKLYHCRIAIEKGSEG
jgi:CelD/BcsL family acetyltransferase involved in cellulose biosynthesis